MANDLHASLKNLCRGIAFQTKGNDGYAAPGRLQDVLALIQVLAFATAPQRTGVQLGKALQSRPSSGLVRWSDVASRHPEFFRVWGQNSDQVALAARYVAEDDEGQAGLLAKFVQHLLRTAVEIHDREARRGDRWTLYLPLLIAIIGAVGSVATALVGIFASRK